jgi:PAS domain S-box-containing protein
MTREDEERFFEDVPVALARTTASGALIALNSAARRLLEMPETAALLPFSLADFVPQPRSRRRAALARAGRGTIELEVRTMSGRTVTTEARVRPIFGPDGALLYLETALFDVSARKRAEAALRERTEYFRALAEGITDMFVAVDGSMVVTYWNAGAVATTRIPTRDAVGKYLPELTCPDESAPLVDALRRVVTERKVVTCSFTCRERGAYRVHQGRAYPTPSGAAAICRDVTERTRIERSLARKREELKRILADQTDLVVRSSANGTILFANPASCAAFGLAEHDVLGQSWCSLLPLAYRERALAERNALSPAGARRVYVVETPAGRKYEWRLRGIFDEGGVLEEVLAVARDVTPLHAVFAEKEALLREVHHRVKNNLQIVGSLLNLQFQSLSDPCVRALLTDSHRRIQAMALVHEHIYGAPDVAKIDAMSYVSALARALRETHAGRRVECVVDVDRVTLDLDTAMRLGLVISELVSNALKHAYPDTRSGEVHVTMRDGDHLELIVADRGRGLPPDFRIEDSPSLGLQLVRQTVEHLGGTVTITSARGARFAIRIPKK